LPFRVRNSARPVCRHATAILVAVLGAAALSGCSWVPFIGSKPSAPPVACPAAVVFRPLSNTVVFGPSSERRPVNAAWYGILSDVSATCSMNGGALRVAVDTVVAAERAPAGGSGNGVDLSYFVAVAGTDHTILSKNPFAVHVAVPAGAKRGGVTDHVEMTVDTGGRPPTDLNLIVGFQQTPDVIAFYQQYRGR
jgi:hypothetical protein